jgi:hypothetical protein
LSGDARHADQVLHENGIARRPDETIFIRDEILLKPAFDRLRSLEKRGSIMLGIIINLLYRQSCRAALSAIRMQSHRWI